MIKTESCSKATPHFDFWRMEGCTKFGSSEAPILQLCVLAVPFIWKFSLFPYLPLPLVLRYQKKMQSLLRITWSQQLMTSNFRVKKFLSDLKNFLKNFIVIASSQAVSNSSQWNIQFSSNSMCAQVSGVSDDFTIAVAVSSRMRRGTVFSSSFHILQ